VVADSGLKRGITEKDITPNNGDRANVDVNELSLLILPFYSFSFSFIIS
jgi:hypothetical protein